MDLDFNLESEFLPMDFETMADYLVNNQTITFDDLELEDIEGRNSELNTPVPELIDTIDEIIESLDDNTKGPTGPLGPNGPLDSADPDSQTPEIIEIKEEPLDAFTKALAINEALPDIDPILKNPACRAPVRNLKLWVLMNSDDSQILIFKMNTLLPC